MRPVEMFGSLLQNALTDTGMTNHPSSIENSGPASATMIVLKIPVAWEIASQTTSADIRRTKRRAK